MWIRNQDKDKLFNIEFDNFEIKGEYSLRVSREKVYFIRGNGIILGCYKYKDQAIEILDQIQRCIAVGEKLYVMPKE